MCYICDNSFPEGVTYFESCGKVKHIPILPSTITDLSLQESVEEIECFPPSLRRLKIHTLPPFPMTLEVLE